MRVIKLMVVQFTWDCTASPTFIPRHFWVDDMRWELQILNTMNDENLGWHNNCILCNHSRRTDYSALR